MKLILLSCILGLTVENLLAQDSICNSKYYPINYKVFEPKLLSIGVNEKTLPLPKNAYYSYWGTGEIILSNGEKLINKIIRYDGVTDNLLIRAEDSNEGTAIVKTQLKGFDIKLQKTNKYLHFILLNYKIPLSNNYELKYFQLLVSGNASLYASRKIERFDGEHSVELRNRYTYLIIKEDGSMVNFENYSKRYISNQFPNKKRILRQLFRKLNFQLNSEESLIKAIELYNVL